MTFCDELGMKAEARANMAGESRDFEVAGQAFGVVVTARV